MLIGRKQEKALMEKLLGSKKAEMLAFYGRRRVGKTYLVKTVYQASLTFEFTGTQSATVNNQLYKFYEKLQFHFPKQSSQIKIPTNWAEAFNTLKKCLIKAKSKGKMVVFFDELPWLASKRSNFLEELAYWWNDWASEQFIVVVLCGSAASWMLKKVIHSKGGLHNRITQRINLNPFTLGETKSFLEAKQIVWSDYEILQLYMSIGGVPSYLNEVEKGESVVQCINRLFFGNNAPLQNEFENLYAALFEGHQNHVSIIKALSQKWKGLTRSEILNLTQLPDGGGFTQMLEELEASTFIMKTEPFGKKMKDSLYRLSDEYSLFYLKYLEKKSKISKNEWQKLNDSHDYTIWCGYAFENTCIKHIEAIKHALGISGIHSSTSSYLYKGMQEEKGFQLDLLIDRSDNTMCLCEMKFSKDEFMMSSEYANVLRKRRELFRNLSKTKKTLFNTLISTYGLKTSIASSGQIDHSITMDQLFLLDHF
jgi:uncharacterized protein